MTVVFLAEDILPSVEHKWNSAHCDHFNVIRTITHVAGHYANLIPKKTIIMSKLQLFHWFQQTKSAFHIWRFWLASRDVVVINLLTANGWYCENEWKYFTSILPKQMICFITHNWRNTSNMFVCVTCILIYDEQLLMLCFNEHLSNDKKSRNLTINYMVLWRY